MDVGALKEWFIEEKRDLPWRRAPTPYQVWVSEVMLQQTQVSVVPDYYKRWMLQFPTVEKLAAASLEEVIKAWEGLGLLLEGPQPARTAKILVEHYGGSFPPTP